MSSKDLEKKEKKKSMVEQNISKIEYSNSDTSIDLKGDKDHQERKQ